MPDNLTLKFKEELSKRGITATDEEITSFLSKNEYVQSPLSTAIPQTGGGLTATPTGPSISTQQQQQQQVNESENALFDFAGSALWGAVSGTTWGVSGFVEPEKYEWEKMNAAEKSGWILGEGMSLFLPWGPFGVMGRASAKIGRVATKSALKKSVEGAIGKSLTKATGGDIIKAVNKVATKELPADKILSTLGKEISSKVEKTVGSDYGMRLLSDLHTTGKTAADAQQLLKTMNAGAIAKAFEKAGVKGIGEKEIKLVNDALADGLKEGKYINDVAHWIETSLRGELPGRTRDFLAKYAGMAAQDFVIMATHGLVAGKMTEAAKGEEFLPGQAISHSFAMALGFPLLRKVIPGGGLHSLSQGVKGYMKRYMKTNYKQIADEHGVDVLKRLARIMLSGPMLKPLNTSKLGGSTKYIIGGVKYGGKDLLGGKSISKLKRSIDDFSEKEVIELLEKLKVATSKNLTTNWAEKFVPDLLWSLPRIGIGTVAMNPWVINPDAWGEMESGELASHLFVSAMMVKGRGAWVHNKQKAEFADFTPYYNALHTLGVNTKNIEDTVNFYSMKQGIDGLGYTMLSHPLGNKIIEKVDKVLADHSKEDITGVGEYNAKEQGDLGLYIQLYNVMKQATGEPGQELRVANLNKKVLKALRDEIFNLEIDGETVKSQTFEEISGKMTDGVAKNVEQLHKQLLLNLKEEFGFEISEESVDGKLMVSKVEGKELESLGVISKVNDLIDTLESLGVVEIKTDKPQLYGDLLKKVGGDADILQEALHETIGEHMDILSGIFGDKVTVRELANNPFINFLSGALETKAIHRLYRIVSNNIDSKAEFSETDRHLLQGLDNLFLVEGVNGKKGYLRSIQDYIKYFADKEMKGDNVDEFIKEVEKEEFSALFDLFNLRKTHVGVIRGGVRKAPKIERKHLKSLVSQFKEDIKIPASIRTNLKGHLQKLFIRRALKGENIDPRANELILRGIEENIIFEIDGEFVMPTREAFIEGINGRNLTPEKRKELAEAYDIYNATIGGDKFVKKTNIMYDESISARETEVDIDKFLEFSQWIKSDGTGIVLERARQVINDIFEGKESKKDGAIGRLSALLTNLNNITNTLDPSIEGSFVRGTVAEAIGEAINTLEGLKLSLGEKEANAIQSQLEAISKKYENFKGGAKTEIKSLDEVTFKEIHDMYANIEGEIQKSYQEEMTYLEKLRTVLNRIDSRVIRGKEDLGIDAGEGQYLIDGLVKDWYRLYADKRLDDIKSGKTLEDLIDKVNTSGSFKDLKTILVNVNQRINEKIVLENPHHPYFHSGKEILKQIDDVNRMHEHRKSVIEIADEYGLLDSEGRIKKEFMEYTSLKGAYKAVRDYVKKAINKSDKYSNDQERSEAWAEFRKKAAPVLLNNILSKEPVTKIKIIANGDGSRPVLDIMTESPNMKSPNTRWYSDKGYKVLFIEDSMVGMVNNKLRAMSIDFVEELGTGDAINMQLADAFRTTNTDELFRKVAASNLSLATKDIEGPIENAFIYVRLSPHDKVAFVATKENIKKVNNDFKTWYTETRKLFSGGSERTFDKMFKHLLDKGVDSRGILELKLLTQYITETGKKGEFIKYIEAVKASGKDKSLETKILTNIFKRSFLSDGGTTLPMNKEVLTWVASGHLSKKAIYSDIKEAAAETLQEGWRVGILADEAMDNLNIKNVSNDILDVIGGNRNKSTLQALINETKADIDILEGLNNSLLDGVKFVTLKRMKLIMAMNGNPIESFSNEANGAKTIVAQIGNGNQLLGKGYAVYHPDIAQHIPNNVDMVMGESSAKTFYGKDVQGNNIVPASPIIGKQNNRLDWSPLHNVFQNGDSVLKLNYDAVGVSFNSQNSDGVIISSSPFDLQDRGTVKEAIAFMGFAEKLKDLQISLNHVKSDGGEVARELLRIKSEHGDPLQRGPGSLLKAMFEYGASSDNPLTWAAMSDFMRTEAYESVSKSINPEGEDNYIAPDVLGTLGAPVFAKIYNSVVDGSVKSRSVARFGGVGVNTHTMKGKQYRGNLDKQSFIISDNNGIDWLVSMDDSGVKSLNEVDKALTFHSPLYNKMEESNSYIDRGGQDKEALNKSDLTQTTKKNILKVLNDLNIAVKNGRIRNMQDMFNVLNGDRVNGFQLSNKPNKGINLVKKYDISLPLMGHSVPELALDTPIFRVERELTNRNGLVEINSFDLRTILQRDNDGDHFFMHSYLEPSLLRKFSNTMGKKSDFFVFEKEGSLTRDYANPFGLGKNNKAGERPTAIGFQPYARRLQKNTFMMGQIVSARSAIGWLNRLGFSEKGLVSGMVGMQPTSHYLKDLIKDSNFDTVEWQVLDRYLDSVQSTVDKHGGTAPIVDKILDFVFFGERLPTGPQKNAPNTNRHTHPSNNLDKEPESIFVENDYSKRLIHREIFHTIIKTLKRANLVNGETYDEAGSRAPTPSELRHARYEIEEFFKNPSQFLFERLYNRVSQLQYRGDGETAKLLLTQIEQQFFPDTKMDMSNSSRREDLYRRILKGEKSGITNEVFGFSLPQKKTTGHLWETSVAGSKLIALSELSPFSSDIYGREQIKQDVNIDFNKAGIFINKLERVIGIAKAYGDTESLQKVIGDEIRTMDLTSNNKKGRLDEAEKGGILRSIAVKQYADVAKTLEFLEGERFISPHKIEAITSQLLELGSVIGNLDIQLAKNFIIETEKGRTSIARRAGVTSPFPIKISTKKKRGVRIYRIKGNVKATKKETEVQSLYDYTSEGTKDYIDYGQLEFVTHAYDGDALHSSMIDRKYTYIIDYNPKLQTRMSIKESSYATALFKVTRGYYDEGKGIPHTETAGLFTDNLTTGFIEDVLLLRKNISYDFSNTISAVKNRKQSALKNKFFSTNNTEEMARFNEFFNSWEKQLADTDNAEMLWRYIIAPQYVSNEYEMDATGERIPIFKTNEHLLKVAMQWAIKTGREGYVKNLIKEVEGAVNNPYFEVDMSSRDRAMADNYDYSAFGDRASSIYSMMQFAGFWFDDPMMHMFRKDIVKKGRGKRFILKNKDEVIPMRKYYGKDQEASDFWEGKGCI